MTFVPLGTHELRGVPGAWELFRVGAHMTDSRATYGIEDHDVDEVTLVARGIATAVAPESGLTDVQADLLEAIAGALTGVSVDYRTLEPLGPDELADVLAGRDLGYRRRIVHHMVLGELVLRPIPVVVAHRVATYAEALGVKDDFVRVARRYAQGAYGLAWMDLQRNGFVEHVRHASGADEPAKVDPELEARWRAFADLPEETLGRSVCEMYDGRGFGLPGTARAHRSTSPSTTSCTCSPTTARTSRASSRCSGSSVALIPTRRASRGWRR